ncbi:MAG TPA: PEPxxWA-CTERM sorting domain-containing protein [Rhizomicrobium sp.]|nr:PEPxxWA-CTERM sorting domain-containing protein [Rhizomicrobium sp.]
MSIRHISAAAVVALMGFAGPAGAAVIFTGSDGSNASVTVSTLNSTTLSVALTDSITPVSDGGALSGVQFLLSSAPASVSLTEVVNPLITFSSGGTFVASSGTPDHWGVGLSGTTITLETVGPNAVGGQPRNLIVDAPTSPTPENGNLTNFNPYIQGTGTFDLVLPSTYIAALAAGTVHITGANFQYSTTAGFTSGVPEPATWAMMLIGFGAVGFAMRGSRRKQLVTA